MEESKAAAYYDELTRKGEGAARFKRGLGFSASDSNSDVVSASKGSALPSSSSFLSSFVKASSPSKASEFEKQAQLEAIQNKLKKKKPSSPGGEERRPRALERDRRKSSPRRRSLSKERERHSHSRRRSSSRDRERHSKRRSRSRDRYGDKYRDRDRERRRRRSRSRSDSDRDRRRRRSRSLSLDRKRSEDNGSKGGGKQKDRKVERQKTEGVDYSRLIEGYDMMVCFVLPRISYFIFHFSQLNQSVYTHISVFHYLLIIVLFLFSLSLVSTSFYCLEFSPPLNVHAIFLCISK